MANGPRGETNFRANRLCVNGNWGEHILKGERTFIDFWEEIL